MRIYNTMSGKKEEFIPINGKDVKMLVKVGDSVLYSKYADKGLKIYQISLDADEHFWKNAASNLPWTCVRDPETVYSQAAALYNVKQLPALFLLDKNGNVVKREDYPHKMENDIKAAL